MCWELHLMEGDRVAKQIPTTAAAIAFFGAAHIRFRDGSPFDPTEAHNYCLCPVVVEHLLWANGYRPIRHRDPRWDSMDTRFEKRGGLI